VAAAAVASTALILTVPVPLPVRDDDGAPAATSEGAFPDPWEAVLAGAPAPDPGPAARVEQADLLAAPVPSLCGHPAGELVDGMLPGIPPGEGVVWIYVDENGRIPAGRVAYGPLGRGSEVDAAVAVYCDRGGTAWPEAVVLYGPGPALLGHVVLSEIVPGRQTVESLRIADGVVTVRFVNSYAADGRPGRVDGTVELVLRGTRVVTRNLELVDERSTAAEALAAAVAGDAARLGDVAVAEAAQSLLDLAAIPLTLGTCSAALAGAPEGAGATCAVLADDALGGEVAQLHLARTGFAEWRVVGVTVAAAPSA